MQVNVCRDVVLNDGSWRVEIIDLPGEGECHSILFMGRQAEALARAYAESMSFYVICKSQE